jgi:hypothetical protein
MPEVRGSRTDDPEHPHGRIENTRKILFLAALIMSVYLLGAVVVTTLLIPAGAFGPRGLATNRALAYLANGGSLVHGVSPDAVSPFFGTWFGVVYDLSTILILCFAGTSVMTALGRLLPRILLRFGMEMRWADRWGVLFLLFAAVNFGLTILFRASVEDQRGPLHPAAWQFPAVSSAPSWRRRCYPAPSGPMSCAPSASILSTRIPSSCGTACAWPTFPCWYRTDPAAANVWKKSR